MTPESHMQGRLDPTASHSSPLSPKAYAESLSSLNDLTLAHCHCCRGLSIMVERVSLLCPPRLPHEYVEQEAAFCAGNVGDEAAMTIKL